MAKGGFRDLRVWQKAKQLAVDVILETNHGSFARDFGLRDQVRRCAVSVPSNIAEGDERDAAKDSVRFFRIAKGSLAELRTQLEIASDIGYLPIETFTAYDDRCEEIAKMLGSLIQARIRAIK